MLASVITSLPDIWVQGIFGLLVAGITALVTWVTARRTARVENRQADIDHDDKILTHYDGLVTKLDDRTKDLEKRLQSMEDRVRQLNEELSLVKVLFDDALRFIRRVRNWHKDGQVDDFPALPESISHLFK